MAVAGASPIAAEAPAEAKRGRLRRVERVAFPELVWAHHLRQRELSHRGAEPYEGPAEHLYRRFEAAFEEQHGEIVSSYWCTKEASGVVLTVRPRPWIIPDKIRLHWATDWATRESPGATALLYRSETLAVKVTEVLRDTSKRVAMQWLFNSVSFVLGFAESERAHERKATEEMVVSQTKELDAIERYYKNSAGRSGQIVYLGGTLLGVLPFLALAAISALFGAFDAGSDTVRTGAVCFAAGAVGAVVSVMSRLNSGRVRVDWEFGKDTLRTLGSLRPFVGGIFGLMTYFALKSGLVSITLPDGDHFAFYVLFSFAAGFSERFAQDMLLGSTFSRGQKEEPPLTEPVSEPLPDAAPAGPQPAV